MTLLDALKREIEASLPGVQAVIDAPSNPMGRCFMDLTLKGRGAVVEWSPKEGGFGVSSLPCEGYGGADEIHDNVRSTVRRLVEILRDGQHTDPKELLLNELRCRLGMSQENLARAMNVRQSTLSKMERRRDVLISSLRKIVEGLGGKLEIGARFPKVLVQLVQFTEPEGAPHRIAARDRQPPRRTARRRLRARS